MQERTEGNKERWNPAGKADESRRAIFVEVRVFLKVELK